MDLQGKFAALDAKLAELNSSPQQVKEDNDNDAASLKTFNYEKQLAEAVSSKECMSSEHQSEREKLLSRIETLEATVTKLNCAN